MRLSGLLGIMALFFLCFSPASVAWDLITMQNTEINIGQFLNLKEEKGGRNFKYVLSHLILSLRGFSESH